MQDAIGSAREWVEKCALLTGPSMIHVCDGSEQERQGLLIKLNQKTHPRCYLHRSHPNDVARSEEVTFICSKNKDDAGPNHRWMNPQAGHRMVDGLFKNCMKDKVMYVIPYVMGPLDSTYARCGVEITDSPYAVLNMRMMTRVGADAAQMIAAINREKIVKGLHSVGSLDPTQRFIMHFPEEMAIKSIGSGYGGNALLGMKCHALRLGSWQAREEGWLADTSRKELK